MMDQIASTYGGHTYYQISRSSELL